MGNENELREAELRGTRERALADKQAAEQLEGKLPRTIIDRVGDYMARPPQVVAMDAVGVDDFFRDMYQNSTNRRVAKAMDSGAAQAAYLQGKNPDALAAARQQVADVYSDRDAEAAAEAAAKTQQPATPAFDSADLRSLLLGQYAQNAASRNDEDMFRAFRKSDEVANNNAAMANVLMSRGVTPALATALLKLNDSNNTTQNNDADRYQRGYGQLRATDQSGANTALNALAQMYNTDEVAAGAKNAATVEGLAAANSLKQEQRSKATDGIIDILTNDRYAQQPELRAQALKAYMDILRDLGYFGNTEMVTAEPQSMGGLVRGTGDVVGYADGGQVDPIADALGAAMADPVAEGAPAAMESGDYVIPADVLRFYGLKFFQGMIQKAEEAELG